MRRRQGATVHLLLVLVLVVGLLKDLAPCSAAAQEEGRATKYIWLMQGKEEMSLDFLRSDHSDAIQVVWGKGPKNHSKDAYYLPDSTCTEGRNFLLQMALLREEEEGIRYDYFIYTEDDAELEEILDFGHNVGDPYRTFERYLHMWEPAVAFPFNGYGMPDPPEEVVAACWWDHLMVAFHRDALPALLPYWTGFDKESWWFPQRIVTVLSAAFFHENRIQVNAVAAMNTQHRWNPDMGDVDWAAVNSWVLPSIRESSALINLTCAFDNDHWTPSAARRRGAREYKLVEGAIDGCHPLHSSRKVFWDSQPSRDRRTVRTHELGVSWEGCLGYNLVEEAWDQVNRVSSLAPRSPDPDHDDLTSRKLAAQTVINACMKQRGESLFILEPKTDARIDVEGSTELVMQVDSKNASDLSGFTIKVFQESDVYQRQPRLLLEDFLHCEAPSQCLFRGTLSGLTHRDPSSFLKAELYRADLSKAATARVRIVTHRRTLNEL